MKALLPLLALTVSAAAQNLIPNWNFANPAPLKSWRYDFPQQEDYVKNSAYVKQVMMQGKRCVVIDLPASTTEKIRAKIETALIPIEPGAEYHAEVDCLTWECSARISAVAYAQDPHPESPRPATEKSVEHVHPVHLPAADGRPALAEADRIPFPEPRSHSKLWAVADCDFTVPTEAVLGGQKVKPAFLVLKVVVTSGHEAGKSYFTNFKLLRIKPSGGSGRQKPAAVAEAPPATLTQR